MNCREVQPFLSSYIDGEIRGAEAEKVKSHLAGCSSCTCAMKAMRQTAGALSSMPEVEPPAYLLERIEAATVRRPTFRERLAAALQTQTARSAGWAGLATACIALGVFFLNPSEQPNDVPTRIAEQPAPAVVAEIEQPATPDIAIREVPSASAHSPASPRKVARLVRGHSRPTRAHKNVIAAEKPVAHVKPAAASEPKVTAAPVEAVVEESVTAEITEKTVAVDPEPKPVVEVETAKLPAPEPKPVKVARAETPNIDARLKQQATSIDEVRKKIASRYDRKRFEAVDRVDGRRYSVELASIKF